MHNTRSPRPHSQEDRSGDAPLLLDSGIWNLEFLESGISKFWNLGFWNLEFGNLEFWNLEFWDLEFWNLESGILEFPENPFTQNLNHRNLSTKF